MKVLDLPSDIISLLPSYLHSITDLYALLSTCRALYHAFAFPEVRLPPILPKLYGQPLLPPHPHLILAGTARQVANWAVTSTRNRTALYESLLEGNDGLFKLSQKVARVSLKDMRELHNLKYSLLNPLSRIIDMEGGPEMVREEGNDPDNYSWTIVRDPDIALLNYWIYCELFHHNIDEILNHSTRTPSEAKALDLKARRRWVAYCMPDINNHRNRHWKEINDIELLSQIQMWGRCDTFTRREKALLEFFETDKLLEYEPGLNWYGRAYSSGYVTAVHEERVNVCLAVANHLGVESLKMLLPGGLYQARARLEEIRERVGMISDADIMDGRIGNSRNGYPIPMGISINGDSHEGIATNMMSEEELAEELAKDEAEGLDE
jgi:hypothetical protein